jgi:hypothetical protein
MELAVVFQIKSRCSGFQDSSDQDGEFGEGVGADKKFAISKTEPYPGRIMDNGTLQQFRIRGMCSITIEVLSGGSSARALQVTRGKVEIDAQLSGDACPLAVGRWCT